MCRIKAGVASVPPANGHRPAVIFSYIGGFLSTIRFYSSGLDLKAFYFWHLSFIGQLYCCI